MELRINMEHLGKKATEKITGFTGVVVAVVEHAFNSPRIGIRSQQLHEGKPINTEFFDEVTVEVFDEVVIMPQPMQAISIGLLDQVEHKYTKLKGTVMGISLWVTGCWRIGIQPAELNKDNSPTEECWAAPDEFIIIKKSATSDSAKKKSPGGPMKNIPNKSNPY